MAVPACKACTAYTGCSVHRCVSRMPAPWRPRHRPLARQTQPARRGTRRHERITVGGTICCRRARPRLSCHGVAQVRLIQPRVEVGERALLGRGLLKALQGVFPILSFGSHPSNICMACWMRICHLHGMLDAHMTCMSYASVCPARRVPPELLSKDVWGRWLCPHAKHARHTQDAASTGASVGCQRLGVHVIGRWHAKLSLPAGAPVDTSALLWAARYVAGERARACRATA